MPSLLPSSRLASRPPAPPTSHEYAKDEYAIIRDGLAPNKRMSLASHGDDENGEGEFPCLADGGAGASQARARSPDIGPDNILDTGPNAYHAIVGSRIRATSPSIFRSDRHVLELNLYAVEGRRARLISGPSLFKDVTSRDVGEDEDLAHRRFPNRLDRDAAVSCSRSIICS